MSIEPLYEVSALPQMWAADWGAPSPFYRRHLGELKARIENLAAGIPLVDASEVFGGLVNAAENLRLPVHRWYGYKESFSPRLPIEVVGRYGAGRTGVVADSFAGVATTQLALAPDPRVERVVGVEFSPFAHFAGWAKLAAQTVDSDALAAGAAHGLCYEVVSDLPRPSLSSFANDRIFQPLILDALLSAKRHLLGLGLPTDVAAILLLGIAATADEVSGVIKDGRALRVAGYGHRKRGPAEMVGSEDPAEEVVRRTLRRRWAEMVADVDELRAASVRARVDHLKGDARELSVVLDDAGEAAFPEASIGLFVSSPPYLNCIDYSEVYKLELWLLDFVSSQESFRALRLGTIRSHPSIEFPARPYLDNLVDTAPVATVSAIADFLEAAHARPAIGRVALGYFSDMTEALRQQYRALEPGGHTVMVVGNSLFSRRTGEGSFAAESWRLPVLTDVLLCRLAELIGFVEPQILIARALRARNVSSGSSRESLVVLRKPLAV